MTKVMKQPPKETPQRKVLEHRGEAHADREHNLKEEAEGVSKERTQSTVGRRQQRKGCG